MQLYINTHGAYVHVRDDLFEIRIPTERRGEYDKRQFAAAKVTAIVLTTSAALSTDAVRLALKNNIDILFASSDGFPLGRVWHSKLGSTTRIRKRQLEASLSQEGVRFVIDWLEGKLTHQIELLSALKKHRKTLHELLDARAEKIAQLRSSIRLQEDAPRLDAVAETLRGLEGTAGRLYFDTLSQVVPPPFQFSGRSFRPAVDAFNAFLNYGYGILYARVEKALMIAGIDPYVGFMHRDDYNQKSMVFDFIEPYRHQVDRVVLRLFTSKVVNQTHTAPLANGITLTKPGKEVVIDRFNQYFDVDRIRHRNRQQTRANALQQDAHRFAQLLLGKPPLEIDTETV